MSELCVICHGQAMAAITSLEEVERILRGIAMDVSNRKMVTWRLKLAKVALHSRRENCCNHHDEEEEKFKKIIKQFNP